MGTRWKPCACDKLYCWKIHQRGENLVIALMDDQQEELRNEIIFSDDDVKTLADAMLAATGRGHEQAETDVDGELCRLVNKLDEAASDDRELVRVLRGIKREAGLALATLEHKVRRREMMSDPKEGLEDG